MKNRIKYISLLIILMSFTACQELDDFEPLFSLDANTAVIDEASAELVLNGVYISFLSPFGEGFPEFFIMPYFLSGASTTNPLRAVDEESISYINNQPLEFGAQVANSGYSSLYRAINRANWLLQGIEDVPESEFANPTRKSEIIAEAKAVRATAHFYILRMWGQFYDIDSSFGIDVRTTPAVTEQAFPRKTVAETYAAIIADLDDAIADAPDLRAKVYMNKTYAKALKAKVLLYQGNYSDAATLAQEVISTSGASFDLATTYNEIFDNSNPNLSTSNELLFGVRGINQVETTFMGTQWGGFMFLNGSISSQASGSMVVGSQTINYDGTRVAANITPSFRPPGFFTPSKYASFFETFEVIYHMRMAEVYLIAAEAEARANNAVSTNALNNLNAVRLRAGATTTGGDGFETYPASISLEQFLEAVRVEKRIELFAEMGEEWFDLVRYDFADGFGSGFQVSDIKPTATDANRFILPIPEESRQAGGNIVDQNPGY